MVINMNDLSSMYPNIEMMSSAERELQEERNTIRERLNEIKREINTNYGEQKETDKELLDEHRELKRRLGLLLTISNSRYGKFSPSEGSQMRIISSDNYQFLFVDVDGNKEEKIFKFDSVQDMNDLRLNLMHSLPSRRIFETASNLLIRCTHSNGSHLYFPVKNRPHPRFEGELFELKTYTTLLEKSLTYEEAIHIKLDGESAIVDTRVLNMRGKEIVSEFIGKLFSKGILS
jgi:hypothetical protein